MPSLILFTSSEQISGLLQFLATTDVRHYRRHENEITVFTRMIRHRTSLYERSTTLLSSPHHTLPPFHSNGLGVFFPLLVSLIFWFSIHHFGTCSSRLFGKSSCIAGRSWVNGTSENQAILLYDSEEHLLHSHKLYGLPHGIFIGFWKFEHGLGAGDWGSRPDNGPPPQPFCFSFFLFNFSDSSSSSSWLKPHLA